MLEAHKQRHEAVDAKPGKAKHGLDACPKGLHISTPWNSQGVRGWKLQIFG